MKSLIDIADGIEGVAHLVALAVNTVEHDITVLARVDAVPLSRCIDVQGLRVRIEAAITNTRTGDDRHELLRLEVRQLLLQLLCALEPSPREGASFYFVHGGSVRRVCAELKSLANSMRRKS